VVDAVRPGAVVVNVAIWDAPATVDMQKPVLKGIDLRGTIAYVRDRPARDQDGAEPRAAATGR
jgi:(R,R)-butanediol dehydrogenase/meso-butanediol dehydrogenase/diacetyl reductase